jgi:hypothetical protein
MPAFDHAYGTTLFQYLAQNAAAGRTFDQAMANVTALASFAVALAYPFSSFSTVVMLGAAKAPAPSDSEDQPGAERNPV